MSIAAIIRELEALPVSERLLVVEETLRSIRQQNQLADPARLVEPQVPLSKRFRGSIPKEYSSSLRQHIKSMRDEWDRT